MKVVLFIRLVILIITAYMGIISLWAMQEVLTSQIAAKWLIATIFMGFVSRLLFNLRNIVKLKNFFSYVGKW